MVNSILPEDIFYEILSYFSYNDDPEALAICALVSRSWTRICRSRWTLKLSTTNFQHLQQLLQSPLTSFSWVRNLEIYHCSPVEAFHKTVPYLAALKRVNSLSLFTPTPFYNFDMLLNLLCIFPSLQSVSLSGVQFYEWTWSPSRPRHRPSLSSITIENGNSGIFQWLQSQQKTHTVRSFRATFADTEEFELMDSFLQPSAGMLQHLDITFRTVKSGVPSALYDLLYPWEKNSAPPDTFSLANYTNLQSLALENVQDAELVPRLLKQITSTELKHLVLDWDWVSVQNEPPCDWSELDDVLAGDQFSNLLVVEIRFYVDGLYGELDMEALEAEVQRCMPKRDGQDFYKLRFKQRVEYSPARCPSW
jgi:hypothetical protein